MYGYPIKMFTNSAYSPNRQLEKSGAWLCAKAHSAGAFWELRLAHCVLQPNVCIRSIRIAVFARWKILASGFRICVTPLSLEEKNVWGNVISKASVLVSLTICHNFHHLSTHLVIFSTANKTTHKVASITTNKPKIITKDNEVSSHEWSRN